MGIAKQEYRQMVKWTLIGVGTFFIYFYVRDNIAKWFPSKEIQLLIGIGLLFIAANYFDITKY